MPTPKVELITNGKVFGGWKTVQVKRSLKTISGSFNLSVINRWPDQQIPWGIVPGDECEIRIAGITVITGYVDESNVSFDENSRGITVSGRDKTADFVDCSAEDKTWLTVYLDKIASFLAAPFGVKVIMQGNPGIPFIRFAVNTGETCFSVLERAARLRGYLLTTDGMGSIVIKRPGGTRTSSSLEEGVNLKNASVKYDTKDCFSIYTVKSQPNEFASQVAAGSGSGVSSAAAAYFVKGSAKDLSIKRYRPHSSVAEAAMRLNSEAQTRAQWESTVRAAKAAIFNCRVQGWFQQDGTIWSPDTIVRVKSPYLGVDGELLLTEVTYGLSNEGMTTDLVLERKDAYLLDPTLKEKIPSITAAIQEDTRR